MADWYKQSVEEILTAFASDAQKGLPSQEADERLGKYGPNEIPEGSRRSPWRILWEQFSAVLVLILIGAALLSALLGEYKDAIAIGTIVILFGLLGFVQEYRAEQAMAALRKLASPLVRLLRGGELVELPAQQIVPGDVILLEAGNLVPADARLLESINLRIQEATLTGESEPVEKEVQALPGQAQTGEAALTAAAAEPGAVRTPSGLVFRSLRDGTGAQPAATDTVRVNYRGTLPDGREFDSSYKRGQPASFALNRVIPCWTEGVQKMKVGGKAKLVCPPALAYGDRGAGRDVPPGATLIFEVELLDVAPAR